MDAPVDDQEGVQVENKHLAIIVVKGAILNALILLFEERHESRAVATTIRFC